MGSDHSAAEGHAGMPTKRESFSCALGMRPVKAGWQCGQQAKDNRRGFRCQCDMGYK